VRGTDRHLHSVRVDTVMFPPSPQGGHCAWLWDVAHGADVTEGDLDEHFTELARSFPIFRNVSTLTAWARNGFMGGAAFRDVVAAGDDGIVASIVTPSGLDLQASVSCDPDDGRIVAVAPRLSSGGSATAVMVAGLRAAHFVVDGGIVLADTLAEALSGEVGRGPIAGARADPLSPHPRWNHAARSRWSEDQLGEGADDGPGQYVILGAGLDSFAYRQSQSDLRIFEVDHPASQGWKRARLARLGIPEPESVSYVAVDFESESFGDQLKAHGFDPARPSLVAWLGVSYYLTPAAINATLSTVARWAPGTSIVFDYHVPERLFDTFGQPFDGNQARSLLRMFHAAGEPMINECHVFGGTTTMSPGSAMPSTPPML
jgi:methyltransferase (TIGR00027 family)